MRPKLTTESYIQKAKKIHGDKYDYSLVEYNRSNSKISIICKLHGLFKQEANSHLQGFNCPKCVGRNKTTEEIIRESIKIHGNKYDYSLTNYINSLTKIEIICKEHGSFFQKPYDHLIGKKCPKCVGKYKTTEEFVMEANIIHNNRYDYSMCKYEKAIKKIKIICNIHGMFEQTPTNHLEGKGCPICCESKGEKEIRNFLISKNIKYKQNKRFAKCKYIRTLPFDFYLPEYNTCIEFDGQQHYELINHWNNNVEKQKIRDNIKTSFCLNNNIQLIRIKYDENILDKLSFLNFI